MLILISLCVLGFAFGIYLLLRKRKAARLDPPSPLPESSRNDNIELTALDQFLYDRCCRYMTEKKPYLVEDFTLADLASALFTNKVYLSRTINKLSGRNFRQYINYYRVMYAMDLFRNNMKLKVSEMAEQSGFRTVTTFTQAFILVMGMAPSIWCGQMRYGQARKKH